MKHFNTNNLRRILYLLGGIFFCVIAYQDEVWWLVIAGLYFIAMSVFRFGCASGNCGYTPGRGKQ